jgi:tRNA nucleotidyltransferase (CCA-adding enzyme)
MKVILTHENADFDAVASLLAMHKLEPDAIPILPHNVNRNVEQYLLLHDPGVMRAEDVPHLGKVELAFVVDTQSFNMVRGMSATTPVYIVDHHHRRDDLPAHHTFTGDLTGANVTLLVERIEERGIAIDSLEATFLLLGIYEDTGNLTYKSTTARDMRAAAWLLEQGADLDIVGEFLHHTMNNVQANLLERLEQSAMKMVIHGHSFVLASTQLDEQVKEAALVAHELLELMGTDAVFIVQQVRENVQIIARSKVDDIDLGGLLREFGGNGHDRAAAGLVRDSSVTSVVKRLIDLLPQYTLQAERVEAIMSQGVMTIDSQRTIAEAQASLMESGHEGYPVVEDGRLVGLLTRRAVDRAVLHHLQNLKVAEIMEAGDYSVRPSDSVDDLKDRMLAAGWGQMPVVDDEGRLIGIATRTDLIKHWGTRPGERERYQALREKFQALLSPGIWALLEAIGRTAEAQHKGLFMVGGIVRDLLMGQPNLDIDLVVEGDAIELVKALQQTYGGTVHFHRQFATAKWGIDAPVIAKLGFTWNPFDYPATIDFATSRAEFYEAPTALPTVRRGSIKLDLHRRDFSINALAMRIAPPPMGQLLDFYNGERDLQHGSIRVLHSLSFIDDPTRILRAVRFEQRFGFRIETRTEELLIAALPLLGRVSGERVRNELELILWEPHALQILERLQALHALEAIHPKLTFSDSSRVLFQQLAEVEARPPWKLSPNFNWLALRFALWLHGLDRHDVETVSERLKLPRTLSDPIRDTQIGLQHLDELGTMPPSSVVAHFEKLGELSWLVNWMLASPSSRSKLAKLATTWRDVHPRLKGDELKTMGLKPGPLTGKLLWELRAAWLDGKFNTEQEEYAYARQWIQENGS